MGCIDRLLRISAVFLGTLAMLLSFAHPEWWIRVIGILTFICAIGVTVIAYRMTSTRQQ